MHWSAVAYALTARVYSRATQQHFPRDRSMFTGTLPFTDTQRPYIALAPMEGLMDGTFRELLTAVGGIDHCVTEFIRVTQQVFPSNRSIRHFRCILAVHMSTISLPLVGIGR